MRWARKFISDTSQGPTPTKVDAVVHVGEQIWVRQNNENNWVLAQLPGVNAAFVALDPINGAIIALVGGLILRSVNLTEFLNLYAKLVRTLNLSYMRQH